MQSYPSPNQKYLSACRASKIQGICLQARLFSSCQRQKAKLITRINEHASLRAAHASICVGAWDAKSIPYEPPEYEQNTSSWDLKRFLWRSWDMCTIWRTSPTHIQYTTSQCTVNASTGFPGTVPASQKTAAPPRRYEQSETVGLQSQRFWWKA